MGDNVKSKSLQTMLKAMRRLERADVQSALNRLVKKGYFVRTDPLRGNRYKSNVRTDSSFSFPFDNTLKVVEMHIANNTDPYGAEIMRSLAYEGKYPDSLPYEPSPFEAYPKGYTEDAPPEWLETPYFKHIPNNCKPFRLTPWEPLGPALFYLATLEYLHEEPLSLDRFKALIGGSLTTLTRRLEFMMKHDHIWQVIPTMSLMTKGQGRKPTRLSIKEPGIQAMNELRKIHDRFKDQREYHHFYTAIKNYLHAAIPSDKALRFNALEPVSKPSELQKLDGGTAA